MSRVTYQEAETYISELPKFTKKNTLEHTQKFLSFLGNPQNGKKKRKIEKDRTCAPKGRVLK